LKYQAKSISQPKIDGKGVKSVEIFNRNGNRITDLDKDSDLDGK